MPPAPALCTIKKFLFSTPNLTVQEQPGDTSVRVADSGNSQTDLKELLIFLEMFYPPKSIQLAGNFKDPPFQSSLYFRGTPTPFYLWSQQCVSGQHQGLLCPTLGSSTQKVLWSLSTKQSANCASGGSPKPGLLTMHALPKLVCITGPHIQKTQTF